MTVRRLLLFDIACGQQPSFFPTMSQSRAELQVGFDRNLKASSVEKAACIMQLLAPCMHHAHMPWDLGQRSVPSRGLLGHIKGPDWLCMLLM